jgi:predicted transcriptional regulator
MKPMIDAETLIGMISGASAKQGEAVRTTVRDVTLKALQGRELTLQNIRKVLKQVTEAASAGALANTAARPQDIESLLEKALAGMDDALLKAVDANRVALERFVEQGVDLQNSQMKKALDDLDRMEDTMLAAVRKGAGKSDEQVAALWAPLLAQMKLEGTGTGARAAQTLEDVSVRMHQAMRESRAIGMRAANAMAQSYAALVGGVLLGMAEGLRSSGGSASAGRKKGS